MNHSLNRRTNLSAVERNFRSRIAQLSSGQWFLRGTLSERAGTCGKANCRCARGELHKSLYLVQSQAGKLRQICVPKAWQQRVRQAVNEIGRASCRERVECSWEDGELVVGRAQHV